MPWPLFTIFFLSGISGLMYEVVWVRMLTRVLGSTVYATSTVLAAFMAGLALGSYLIGRFIDRFRRPLFWYAALELGIGLSAVLSLTLPDRMVPLYRLIYELAGGSRAWLTVGQVSVSLLLLLLPTALMGATLPTLSAFGNRRHEGFGSYVGALYGWNTLGAVVGVLGSGFLTIAVLGETGTILVGVALNLAVSFAALILARSMNGSSVAPSPGDSLARQDTAEAPQQALYGPGVRRMVLVCFAASGFVALGLEVVWGRMLLLYQGTSIYAFSAMLAVVLSGIGLGSYFGGRWIDRRDDPLVELARLELMIALFGVLSVYHFDKLPFRFMVPYHLTLGQASWSFLCPVLLLGPLGVLWGIAFPVAVRCHVRSRHSGGHSVAELYACNTIGCIAGSLAAGFVLLPMLGASRGALLLSAISLVVGLGLLVVHPSGLRRGTRPTDWAAVAFTLLLLVISGDPYRQLIESRAEKFVPGHMVLYRHGEDASGTTTAFGSDVEPLRKHLWVNGTGMTELTPVTKLMAHLPLWLADNPREMLVICFGMGTSFRSASRHRGVNVRAVELVPAVVEDFGFFHPDAQQVLKRPSLQVIIDDGRNYLQMHPRRYDVISIDPAPPLHSAGTVNLYSREFFRLCRDRLQPGGVMCLWIPPENVTEAKMIINTFLDVFPQVQVWSGVKPYFGFLMIGTEKRIEGMERKIPSGYLDRDVVADLVEWSDDFDKPEKVIGLYMGSGDQLRGMLVNERVITDDRPYTEFPLGRAIFHADDYRHGLSSPAWRKAFAALPPRHERAERSPIELGGQMGTLVKGR